MLSAETSGADAVVASPMLEGEIYPFPNRVAHVTIADATRQDRGVAYFQPDRLFVEFNRPVEQTGSSGPHSALNLANWRLRKDDIDVSHLISSIRVENGDKVTLTFSGPLSTGTYRVIAHGTIYDDLGRPIDGDDNYTLGGDADVTFIVASAQSGAASEVLGISPEQHLPVTAADADGNYVVAWIGLPAAQSDGGYVASQAAVLVQRYDAVGQKLGGVIVVEPPLPNYRFTQYDNLQLAMSPNGAFVVSWTIGPGEILALGTQWGDAVARRFYANGQAQGESFLVAPGNAVVQSLSLNDDGELVVGYRQHYPWQVGIVNPYPIIPLSLLSWPLQRDPELFIQRYRADNAAQGEPIALGLGSDLLLAVNSLGYVAAVWHSLEPGARVLTLQRFDPENEPLSERIRLSWLPGVASSPALGITKGGTLVVAWDQTLDGLHRVMVQRLDWQLQFLGPQIEASLTASPFATRPAVATHRSGSFFVTWDVLSPSKYRNDDWTWLTWYPNVVDAEPGSILARGFDASGTPRGLEFPIGTIDASAGARSSVMTADGKLVVAWVDGYGFYAPESRPDIGGIRSPLSRSVTVRPFAVPVALTIDLNGQPPGNNIKRTYYLNASHQVTLADSEQLTISGAAGATLQSATITIHDSRPGDVLGWFGGGTSSLFRSFTNGVLKLEGTGTIERYRADIRSLYFSTTARAPGETVKISVVINDGVTESAPATAEISIHSHNASASIVGRYVFYNNSAFDGNNPAANAADDAAIATDKTALLPNQTATFANYTSYSRGINGIMVDLAGQHGVIEADDFIFRIGDSNSLENWAYAPQPLSFIVRPGAGVGGSDRIEMTWPDGVLKNVWLQVIVLENGNTRLDNSDVFMFGNQVGEAGDASGETRVGAADVMRVVNRLLAGGNRAAAIDSPLDFNRDGEIGMLDLMAALNQALADQVEIELIRIYHQNAMNGAIIAGGLTAVFTTPINPPTDTAVFFARPQPVGSVIWLPEEDEVQAIALATAAMPPLLLDPDAKS